MELIISDRKIAYTAEEIVKAVEEMEDVLDEYVAIMKELSEVGISSKLTAESIDTLISFANASRDALAASIEGFIPGANAFIADIDAIDSFLY